MTSHEFQYDKVLGRIADLRDALDQTLPNMPVILQEIHSSLREDPEIVTLLSEDEIATIVKGLEQYEDTVIVERATKKTSGRKKAVSKLTADDL